MASQSVHPILQDSHLWPTDVRTDHARYMRNNSPVPILCYALRCGLMNQCRWRNQQPGQTQQQRVNCSTSGIKSVSCCEPQPGVNSGSNAAVTDLSVTSRSFPDPPHRAPTPLETSPNLYGLVLHTSLSAVRPDIRSSASHTYSSTSTYVSVARPV